jgi:hypothetical protein
MNRVPSETRALAARLIALELRSRKAGESKGPAAFPVCETLRPQLATLMGSAGFHALLTRALAVARAEDPWLRAVEVEADGSLRARDEAEAMANTKAMTESSVVLVSHLLGLLVAFIGDALTLRMVREVWPKLPLDESDFRKGDTK